MAALLCAATAAWAQQPPAEEPGWAKGRPKTEAATRMAPVPAFPIPTAADKLPTAKFKLPPGFKVETWASGVLDARELRQGAQGHRVREHAVRRQQGLRDPREGHTREAKTIIDKMEMATGIEYYKGALYVATQQADHALRQRRGQARQPRHAGGAVRQAARRPGPQLALPAHPQRQALLRGRRALQPLRSGRAARAASSA